MRKETNTIFSYISRNWFSYLSLLSHFFISVGLIGLPREWRKRVDKGDMGGRGGRGGGIPRYRSLREAHYLITCIVEEVGETCSRILSPWLGYIVDSGTGLSYQPARLHRLAGRFDSPMPESTISLSQGLRFGHSSLRLLGIWGSKDKHNSICTLLKKIGIFGRGSDSQSGMSSNYSRISLYIYEFPYISTRVLI